MKKINETLLLEMADRGDQQQDIAKHFGCSNAAISKTLKRIRQRRERSAALDTLTPQQQTFVAEVCAGTGQTQSARLAYDCVNPESAKAIGNKLMKDADIQKAINIIMEEHGLSRGHLIKALRRHVDGDDQQVSLRATVEGLKLHDCYPASRNLNMNVNADVSPVDLSKYR